MSNQNELSFLPDDYLERKSQRRTNAICAVMFIAVMGGVGTAFTLSEKATRATEAQCARIEEQYLNEAKRIEQVRQMQEKQQRMAQQAELTASLLEKVPRNTILAEITNSLPTGVSLFDFTLESRQRSKPTSVEPAKTAYEQKKQAQQGAKPAVAAPEAKVYDVNMKVTGVAETDVQVAAFLTRLSSSPFFKDVNLLLTDEFKEGEQKMRKFQIELNVNPSADAHAQGPSSLKNQQTTSVQLKE